MGSKHGVTLLDGPPEAPDAAKALPRRLGVLELVLLIIAFNAPIAAMAGFAQLSVGFGNGTGAPVSFLVAGATLMLFSVGFIGMSRYMRNPGAFYQFVVAGIDRESGLAAAFLATAAYLLIGAGAYPYMGLVAVDAMTRLFGTAGLSWFQWSLVFLAIVAVTGFLRIDLSMRWLGKLVCLEVALVAIWEFAVIARGGPEGRALASFTPQAFRQGSVGLSVLFAMLCMIGIEAGACFRAETKDPDRAVGRATYIAIAFLGIFYSLGIWAYIITQGPSHAVASAVSNPVGTFFVSTETYVGHLFVTLVSLTLVTSQMIALSAAQGSASRYLFALGRDHVLPARLAHVHPRLQSPTVAVSIVAGFGLTLLLIIKAGGLSPVTAYAALTGMGIYFLLPLMIATSCAIIVFFAHNPGITASSWTRFGAPGLSACTLAILFVLTSLHLDTLTGSQSAAAVAMMAVILVPLSGWSLGRYYRQARPAIYAMIGNQSV